MFLQLKKVTPKVTLSSHLFHSHRLFFPGPLAALTLSPLLTSRLGALIPSPMSLLVALLLSGFPWGSRSPFQGQLAPNQLGDITLAALSAPAPFLQALCTLGLELTASCLTALVVVLRGVLKRPVVALVCVGCRRVGIVAVSCKETGRLAVSRGPGFPVPGKTTWTQPSGQDGLPLDVGPVS